MVWKYGVADRSKKPWVSSTAHQQKYPVHFSPFGFQCHTPTSWGDHGNSHGASELLSGLHPLEDVFERMVQIVNRVTRHLAGDLVSIMGMLDG